MKPSRLEELTAAVRAEADAQSVLDRLMVEIETAQAEVAGAVETRRAMVESAARGEAIDAQRVHDVEQLLAGAGQRQIMLDQAHAGAEQRLAHAAARVVAILRSELHEQMIRAHTEAVAAEAEMNAAREKWETAARAAQQAQVTETHADPRTIRRIFATEIERAHARVPAPAA